MVTLEAILLLEEQRGLVNLHLVDQQKAIKILNYETLPILQYFTNY